tara:strand:+ start:423 stop:620 length:198 start_codon:yes stop_codon:yes gene_type:complete
MWRALIMILIGFVVALLILLGRAFSKDLENYYTKEKYPDPEGKKIGYMLYAVAMLVLAVSYFFLG